MSPKPKPQSAAALVEIAATELRRGSKLDALVAMLAAWRRVRSTELADAIDDLTHQLEAERLPAALGGNKQRAWLDALAGATPADLPRLYAALIDTRVGLALARLEQLRGLPADPRFARWLWAWLRDVPFPGPAARGFYVEVAAQLRRIGDARFDAEIRESRDGEHYTLARLSGVGARTAGRAFSEVVAEVEGRTPVVVDAALAESIAALVAAIRERATATVSEEQSEAALLAAIHADPGSDAPRLVFADFLQRRGDPRGEFIVLQCFRHGTDAKPSRRERELLGLHSGGWLDGLDPFVLKGGREFQRGFLAACRFFHNKLEPDPLVVAAWSTIEMLDVGAHVFETRVHELVSHPRMSQLRAVRGLSFTDFAHVCASERELPIESLHLRWGHGEHIVRVLDECRSLPRLRVLDLRDCTGTVDAVARIEARWPGLRVLTIG